MIPMLCTRFPELLYLLFVPGTLKQYVLNVPTPRPWWPTNLYQNNFFKKTSCCFNFTFFFFLIIVKTTYTLWRKKLLQNIQQIAKKKTEIALLIVNIFHNFCTGVYICIKYIYMHVCEHIKLENTYIYPIILHLYHLTNLYFSQHDPIRCRFALCISNLASSFEHSLHQ